MRPIDEILSNKRLLIHDVGDDGGFANAFLLAGKQPICIVFSWGGGWDHVSASYDKRCPTWDEMCAVKDIFFKDDEWAVQYHPAKSDYVNLHPYCLHLWREQDKELAVPPDEFV